MITLAPQDSPSTDLVELEDEDGHTVIIKARLFTHFVEMPNPHDRTAPDVLTEQIAHMGEEVNVNDRFYQRGKDLDAFYTDDEADAIRDGSYNGPDAENLYAFREGRGLPRNPQVLEIEPVDGEGAAQLSAEDLADVISNQKLNVEQTVALSDGSLESAERVLDAENIASGNDPRAGVVHALEAQMRAAS